MLSKGFAGRHGVMLSLIGITATLWLAVTGKLELYIHPRYVPFTVAMALIAATVSVAGFVLMTPGDNGHPEEPPKTGLLRATGSLLMVAIAVVGLLILPPATLPTSAT